MRTHLLSLSVSMAILAVGVVAPAATATAAAAVPLIPRDALFGNPERAQVQLSPDGKYLSWIAAVNGVLNVWVAPVDALDKARAVTADTGRGIRQYFWSYRPDTLLYMRDTGGDEDFHLYAVDLTTNRTRDLTPFAKTTAEVIGLSRRRPETLLVGMNDRDPRWHDVYRVDLASGERTLVERNDQQIGSYLADDDYRLRYGIRSREDGGEVLLRRAGDRWEHAEDIPFEDVQTTRTAGMTADGSILYMIDSRDRDTSGLYAVHTTSGKRTLLYEDARADVDGGLKDPRTGRVQAVSVNYLRPEWTTLDSAIAADLERLRAIGPGEATITSRTLDDRSWIVAYSAAEQPAVYYRYERDGNDGGGELIRLFSARPALDGQPLVPMWPQEIRSRDGKTLVSYLTLPKSADPDGDGKANTPVPLVLLVHGGPWARDRYGYSSEAQWLANRGYAVLGINYRGSTGFGKSFTNAGDGEWGARMHDDLLDGVQWAVDNGISTRDTVAIMGGSYGGYATLVGLTFTPDAFACGVDIVGPSNLKTLLDTVPSYWASFYNQLVRRMGDPRTEEGRTWLSERSPLTRAARIRKPLLIGQGANDPRVKQAESDQIVEAMQANGIPVTYVLFPDEGHGFARPENSKAFNSVTESFLQQCLGGRAEPIGGDLAGSSITVPTGAKNVPGLQDALRKHEQVIRK